MRDVSGTKVSHVLADPDGDVLALICERRFTVDARETCA